MITSPLTRDDLSRLFPNNLKAVIAFEQLFLRLGAATEAISAGVDATDALNDATIVTLSPNNTLNNERVLAVDPSSMTITDTGGSVILGLLSAIAATYGYRLAFNLGGDTDVTIPYSGTMLTSGIGVYADDAAAAAGGVGVGEFYKRPAGGVAWRVS